MSACRDGEGMTVFINGRQVVCDNAKEVLDLLEEEKARTDCKRRHGDWEKPTRATDPKTDGEELTA